MKKTLSLILIFILFIPLTALADHWSLIAQNGRMSLLLDKQSLTAGGRDFIYTLRVKLQFTEDFAREIVARDKLDEERYQDYAYDIARYQIDIKTHKIKELGFARHDTKGRVLYKADAPKPRWTTPRPGTIGQHIYNAAAMQIAVSLMPAPETVAVKFPGFENYLLWDTFNNIAAKQYRYFDLTGEKNGVKEYIARDDRGDISFSFRAGILISVKRHYFDADMALYRQKTAALNRLYGKPLDSDGSLFLWAKDGIFTVLSPYSTETSYFYISVSK